MMKKYQSTYCISNKKKCSENQKVKWLHVLHNKWIMQMLTLDKEKNSNSFFFYLDQVNVTHITDSV